MEIDCGDVAQFHMVSRGSCWLGLEGRRDLQLLSPGDVVICPTGVGHWLADEPHTPKLSGAQVLQDHVAGRTSFAGRVPGVVLICGHFAFNRALDHPFLRSLPELIHLRIGEHPELAWLETSLNVVLQEHAVESPGSTIAAVRIAEVLFIQLLRAHMSAQTPTVFSLR